MIAVGGELDFGTVDLLCRQLEDQAAPHRHVKVDLFGATFSDRAAIDALTQAAARARNGGCRISWRSAGLGLRVQEVGAGSGAVRRRLTSVGAIR